MGQGYVFSSYRSFSLIWWPAVTDDIGIPLRWDTGMVCFYFNTVLRQKRYLYSFSRSWFWGKERNAALGDNKWYFLASALPVWFSLIFSNLKVPDLWKEFAPEMVHLMPSYNSISSMSFCVKYVIYKVPLLRIDRRLFLANVYGALTRMFPQL